MNKKFFLSAPHMGENELKYIQKVFQSNYIAPLGEYVDQFEKSIVSYTNSQNALAVSSGTAAIHLALRVLDIGKDDDVLASTFTFIGSINAILYQGANPVFIDSDEHSWNLSFELLKQYLSTCKKRPKALILTHLYGQCADIERIKLLCQTYGIYLIEDAAESLGATFGKKHTGTFGDLGIYSFNGNKIITTSGGGMLVSPKQEWIEKAKFYATQAREPENFYQHEEYGYNYRLSNVLAAIGVAQMEILDEHIKKKREIFSWYKKYLSNREEIIFMPELQESRGNRWLSTLILKKTDYRCIIKALNEIGAESRPLWKPMHMQPLFKNAQRVIDGTSEYLFQRGLCLPSSIHMLKEDVKMISSVIKKNLK